jgi:hypothetical protein
MRDSMPLVVNDSTMNLEIDRFPLGNWDPDVLAKKAMLEFLKLDWETAIDARMPPVPSPETTREEIKLLKAYLTGRERREAAGEIIQQDQNFQIYWMHLMSIAPGTHPKTLLLLKIAARVGEALMVHYKHKFSRPRPSQICPALMPLLALPGHASYPSGHSLMSHLTSQCLADLAPWAKNSLTAMAERVALNREFAGLHYPSDSKAGRIMAHVIHDMLPDSPTYRETFDAAAKEWPSYAAAVSAAAE